MSLNKPYKYDQKKFRSLPDWVRQLLENVYGTVVDNPAFIRDYELAGTIQDLISNLIQKAITVDDLTQIVTTDTDKVPSNKAVYDADTAIYSYVDDKIDNLPTPMQYIGNWNADTNTPTLVNPDLTKVGHTYTVIGPTISRFGTIWTAGDVLVYDSNGNPVKWDIHDASVANKLDKVTTPSTYLQAYIKTTAGGQTMVNVSTVDNNGHIVQRDINGQIVVPLIPADIYRATSKGYVDGNFLEQPKTVNGLDMNTVTSTGFYHGYNMTNGPLSTGEITTFIVQKYSPDWIVQLAFIPTSTETWYMRSYHSGSTWSAWARMPRMADLDGKLDKNTGVNRIYATNHLGNQILLEYTTNAINNTIPIRTPGGNITVGSTPTSSQHATSKGYVDDLNANKLDKVTTPSSYYRLYVKTDTGTQAMVNYSTSIIAEAVVARDANGQINVPYVPTSVTHATSKDYVDGGLNNKLDRNTSSSSKWQAYVKSNTGGQHMTDIDSVVSVNGTIVARAADGQLLVPLTPTASNHAASKAYVDAAISGGEVLLATLTGGQYFNLSLLNVYSRFRIELDFDNTSDATGNINVFSMIYSKNAFVRKSATSKVWQTTTETGTYVETVTDVSITSSADLVSYLNDNYPASSYPVGSLARGTNGNLPVTYYYAKVGEVTSYKMPSITMIDSTGRFTITSDTQAQFISPTATGVSYKLKVYGLF